MILAADRPNYIPTIGYFHKMARADVFVLADDILYTSGSSVNRAAIKGPGGKQWLTLPVLSRGKGTQKIREVKIDPERNWRQKHWKAMSLNYKYAPYFEYYGDFFQQLYQKEWRYLIDLNAAILEFLRKALGISGRMVFSSELGSPAGLTEKIVDIVKKTGCRRYLAWQGDQSFLETNLFAQAEIELQYLNEFSPAYPQQFGAFLPNLSIIDLLFNLGPEARDRLNSL